MNDHEMNRLFAGYRDALGTCGKTPSPAPRKGYRRLAWAATAVVAAVVGGVALWPTDAAAEALSRMEHAIVNARSMELIFEMQRPSGAWQVFDHEYTRGGMWRMETRQGTPLEATFIFREGQRLEDYRQLDHATVAPGDLSELLSQSALDYAKQSIDSGSVSIERTLRVQPHEPVNGVPTYMLVFDREEDKYHGEILVDARNDLPIRAEVSVRYSGETGGLQHFRQTYRFNATLPNALFEPSPKKPLLHLSVLQTELENRWRKPLARVGDTEVRDARVSGDGTIWIMATVPQGQQTSTLPFEVEGTKPYVRLRDLSPAVMMSGYQPIRFDDEEIVIVGFIPLDPSVRPDDRVKVQFARREAAYVNVSGPDAPAAPADEVWLPLQKESSPHPDYFTAFALDHFDFQLPVLVWSDRAEALAKAGRELDAAKAYERCASEYAGFIRYGGFRPLRKAAGLYRKLGMEDEARRTAGEAEALLATRRR